MLKKYWLIIPVLAIAIVAGLGIKASLAFGGWGNADPSTIADRWTAQLTREAQILGISLDEMKADWAQGLSMQQIATQKGISAADLQTKIQAARLADLKNSLQAMVSKGVITQAQADARLQFMTTRQANGGSWGPRRGGCGRGAGIPGGINNNSTTTPASPASQNNI